ncbi:hypothetical protein IEQ34_019007 [Dendrobium chrysotoxum]|uniref:Uncharacterized protein n=1 Tax=Dendrobium chrysotoxum TaxID=161865 RepID=A0AAV7G7H2_DENCH|nr:hypothetical protein IEQ34_019007 [Dendrobium chrysotoxum]
MEDSSMRTHISSQTNDNSIPSHDISVGHFIEHMLCMIQKPGFSVQIDQCGGNEDIAGEGRFEDMGMDHLG